ncbi:MAG: transposase [Armatimonadetes bacterium]|nr:transposase [Armatimonadota bacterium]
MVIRLKGQTKPKLQTVVGVIRACEIWLSYRPNTRGENWGTKTKKRLWLAVVEFPDTELEPLLLLTDWPVVDQESALRIFRMYRQRWSVEDSFKFIKEILGFRRHPDA